jgi:hypothetical protein
MNLDVWFLVCGQTMLLWGEQMWGGENSRKTAEVALGINGKNEPGNVKGTDGKSNLVLDKRDRNASLKKSI